jgi:glycosyltransferase involved in cell wall biosynthesis
MGQPKVSICIPTYKQLNYLRKTLDSVVIQDQPDLEIIVTDDTPDDSVKKLIDTYDFKGNLKYYKNSTALGSPENWNECIRKASGKYIKIMHHDDWFYSPTSLRTYVEALENAPTAGFAFSLVNSYNEKLDEYSQHKVTEEFLSAVKADPTVLFFGNLIGPPSAVIFKKDLNLSFDKNLKWVVDIDFYIQCLLKTSFVFINEVLISSVNNAVHSVTNDCINKEVEVFEYTYLYHKIHKSGFNKRYVDFFKELFKRYDVSKNELKVLTKGMKTDSNMKLALIKKKVGI